MKSAREIALPIVTIAVVAGAMGVTFFYKGDWPALKEAFRTARWGFAPLAVLAGLLVYPVKALRWRLILGRNGNAPYKALLSAIMIGFMANCIISRLGELIRAAVLSIRSPIRTSTALASIALERIFDICTVVVFLILALQQLGPAVADGASAEMLGRLRAAKITLGAGLAVAVLFLLLLRFYPHWMSKLLECCSRPLPVRSRERVNGFLRTFLQGMDTLRSWKQVAAILVLSVIHWALQVCFFLLAGWCFPEMGMTLPVALLIFAVVAFGVAGLPLPGYIGIYQVAILAAGGIVGMEGAERLAAWRGYSWLSWCLNIPFVVLVGFIFLWKEDLSLGQIRKQAAAAPKAAG